MTKKLEQAARQALEALEFAGGYSNGHGRSFRQSAASVEAITALREALAEQAEQEPVGYVGKQADGDYNGSIIYEHKHKEHFVPVFTAPVQQAEQEPVAERFEKMHANGDVWITTLAAAAIARNAAPVRTKDLTNDEIDEIESEILMGGGEYIDVIRAVIAAHKEKNKPNNS